MFLERLVFAQKQRWTDLENRLKKVGIKYNLVVWFQATLYPLTAGWGRGLPVRLVTSV